MATSASLFSGKTLTYPYVSKYGIVTVKYGGPTLVVEETQILSPVSHELGRHQNYSG